MEKQFGPEDLKEITDTACEISVLALFQEKVAKSSLMCVADPSKNEAILKTFVGYVLSEGAISERAENPEDIKFELFYPPLVANKMRQALSCYQQIYKEAAAVWHGLTKPFFLRSIQKNAETLEGKHNE